MNSFCAMGEHDRFSKRDILYSILAPLFLLFASTIFPTQVFARVYISEVAWMGSKTDMGVVDANDEWIELYNDGEALSLSGWSLSWEGGKNGVLPASIPSQGLVTLCRSNGGLSGSLNNTGQTLVLKDANGKTTDGLGDFVDGANGWKIDGVVVGNNTTKETMQRSGDPPTGAWTTGTPSRGVCTERASSASGGGGDTTSISRSGGGGGVLRTVTERDRLQKMAFSLSLPKKYEVKVREQVPFSVRALASTGREVPIYVVWNFGDGVSQEGTEVSHAYIFPGTYTLAVYAEYSAYGVVATTTETRTVVVREEVVRVNSVGDDFFEIENMTSASLDIGGAILFGGVHSFTFPSRTVLASGVATKFSTSVTGVLGEKGFVCIRDGKTLFSYAPRTVFENTSVYAFPQKSTIYGTPKESVSLEEKLTEEIKEDEVVEKQSASALERKEKNTLWWWIFVAGLLALLVVVSILLARREEDEVLEGYKIEE
jgi:hypothetical protein